MKKVIFYEKTGCKGNARQKSMLESAGYTLEVLSILDTDWDQDELRTYFGNRPVAEWFNWKAPAVKRGDVDPASFSAEDALEIMLREPILIRRPLIDLDGQRACGFDDAVQEMLGILQPAAGMEACQRTADRCE